MHPLPQQIFETEPPRPPARTQAGPARPFVRFDRVQKSYDGRSVVVQELNLDIAQHEFLTMLGPSGSGKTTCLMMLAGFETATSGEILLAGRPVNRIPPERRNIGMVFQQYALFPHLTVRENLEFPLRVRRIPAAEIDFKVRRALDMVNLSSFGGRMPAQLSGGQQQRVAVARALVFEPTLVLMDEPLGALDKQLREQMQYEIKRLHRELGLTVVYVTHDQAEALTMSDRVAVFDQGVIQQLAAPADLYERPVNAFVAGFIGENNEIDATVCTVDGEMCEARTADGMLLRALNVCGATAGTTVRLSVRPERINVQAPAREGWDTLRGVVEQLVYLGDHLRIVVRRGDGSALVAKVPNVGIGLAIEQGTAVVLSWKPVDCRALR